MNIFGRSLIIITLGFVAIPSMADATNDDVEAICQTATKNQIRFAEEAKQMIVNAAQYATTAEQKQEIERKSADLDNSINKLKSPEGQQECLAEYKKDPKVVRCLAAAKDIWATVECAPVKSE